MADEHVAGMAVAVARNGELVYSSGLGYRNVASGKPVTAETVFGIASVSKSFAALSVVQLAGEGKLDIDDPVVKHLPAFRLVGAPDMNEVKVRHLLSHTTGVPPLKRRPDLGTWDAHLGYLATPGYDLLGCPGEYMSYSNDTFLVLGMLVERISGLPFREYVTKNVLQKVGMPRSTYDIGELVPMDDVTERYVWDRKEDQLRTHPWFEPGRYEVGGGISSTVLDLVRYGRMYTGGGRIDGVVVAPGELLAEMWRPVYEIAPGLHYCLALRVKPCHAGLRLVSHGGSQVGVASHFGFVPEEDLVVAVLMNTSGAPAGTVWTAALNTALGLPLELGMREEPTYTPSEEEMGNLAGTYSCAEGGMLTVKVEGGRLLAGAREEYFAAEMTGPDTVVVDAHHQQARARFYFDASGRPWAVYTHSRMMRKEQ